MMQDSGNLFAEIPTSLPAEVAETLCQSGAVRVERILSRGHTAPDAGEWYDQDADEWVVLLAGHARLRFENEEADRNLARGDWLYIPAHRRHRVTWTSDDETCVWLAVHAPAACE